MGIKYIRGENSPPYKPNRPANFISAEEAKAETLDMVKGPGLAPYLELVYAAIRDAIAMKQFYVHNPQELHEGLPSATPEMEEAILAELEAAGYEVKRYPEDDSHCTPPYVNVCWK